MWPETKMMSRQLHIVMLVFHWEFEAAGHVCTPSMTEDGNQIYGSLTPWTNRGFFAVCCTKVIFGLFCQSACWINEGVSTLDSTVCMVSHVWAAWILAWQNNIINPRAPGQPTSDLTGMAYTSYEKPRIHYPMRATESEGQIQEENPYRLITAGAQSLKHADWWHNILRSIQFW